MDSRKNISCKSKVKCRRTIRAEPSADPDAFPEPALTAGGMNDAQ